MPALSPAATPFPLYNLSILLPLPQDDLSENHGLGADGCRRALLETELFAEIPSLLQIPRSIEENYRMMKIVGIRFDLKQEELRLVFQPLYERETTEDHSWGADDAALHLFYKMPRRAMLDAQKALVKAFPKLPIDKLGIHPRLHTAAGRAPIATLLCAVAKLELFKVTFMNVRGNRVVWNFGGFFVTQDARGRRTRGTDVAIANARSVFMDEGDSDMSVQRVSRFQGAMNAGSIPRVEGGDNMNSLFALRGSIPVQSVADIRRTVDRIESPLLNTPNTVDCLSCHATESARVALEEQHHSRASSEAYPLPAGYTTDASVDRATLRNTANFRAFGYLDNNASVNRRVLNDTVQMQSIASMAIRLEQR